MRMLPMPSPLASSASECCACGCGEHAPPGKRFRQYHNARTLADQRYKHSVANFLPSESASFLCLSGEQEMMLAQLQDASHHKQKCKTAGCKTCRMDRVWAMNTAAWGLYAFTSVCEHLGIDWGKTRQWFLATAR